MTNRQRSRRVCSGPLRTPLLRASSDCLRHPGTEPASLPGLREVEVSLVSDRTIALLHHRFLNIPGPTDVITFDHGEIIVSVDTAARHAAEYAQALEQEIFRYAVHGLLHLNGHEDASAAGAAAMWRAQERIVAGHWPPTGRKAAANKKHARR